jgi:hypothetical protein
MTSFIKYFANATIALSLLCGIAFAQSPASDKPKAAVYIKGNPQGRDVLRMAVNTFLIKTGMYQMVAVDAIDLLAQEHIRQHSGSVSDNEIAKLGRDAGAQYVCVVERTEIDGVSYVTTSMVSVQSKIAEFSDMKELPRGARVLSVIERQINTMLGISSDEEEPSSASYSYANDQAESGTGYASPSSYSSSDSRSDMPERKSKSHPEAVLEPFNSSAFYAFFNMNTVDSRDYGDKEYRRSARFGGVGWDIFKSEDARNLIGGGLFLGGGSYGDGIWGLVLGIEAKNLFWLVKRHLAVPISIGFDWRPARTKIENKVAAEFIDVMSENDKVLDTTMSMIKHDFDFTPAIGLQIFVNRMVSVYVGYAYNVNISTGDWNVTYKIPGKTYSEDVSGDAFKVPDKYTPLQNAKESFLGVPGTLRVALKFHMMN